MQPSSASSFLRHDLSYDSLQSAVSDVVRSLHARGSRWYSWAGLPSCGVLSTRGRRHVRARAAGGRAGQDCRVREVVHRRAAARGAGGGRWRGRCHREVQRLPVPAVQADLHGLQGHPGRLSEEIPRQGQVRHQGLSPGSECNASAPRGTHVAACEAAVAVRLARRNNRDHALEDWLFSNQSALTPDVVKTAAREVGGVNDFDAHYQGTAGGQGRHRPRRAARRRGDADLLYQRRPRPGRPRPAVLPVGAGLRVEPREIGAGLEVRRPALTGAGLRLRRPETRPTARSEIRRRAQ